MSNDDLIELKYSKGNHYLKIERKGLGEWGKGARGGGGGLTSYKHLLFKRNLPFSQIVWENWNTKSEIGLQQYDYEIRR